MSVSRQSVLSASHLTILHPIDAYLEFVLPGLCLWGGVEEIDGKSLVDGCQYCKQVCTVVSTN